MEKVIRELAAMYKEAGVALTTVYLGGDEVARDVWQGYPKCQALMKEKGMTKPHNLAEYSHASLQHLSFIAHGRGGKFC